MFLRMSPLEVLAEGFEGALSTAQGSERAPWTKLSFVQVRQRTSLSNVPGRVDVGVESETATATLEVIAVAVGGVHVSAG
jgi:hypothetical protein